LRGPAWVLAVFAGLQRLTLDRLVIPE
jgi:hypothetical protein